MNSIQGITGNQLAQQIAHSHLGQDNSACVPQRQPEVFVAVERFERLLASLDGISHALAERLAPVMRSEPPSTPTTGNSPLKAAATPLADRIEGLCNHLEVNMDRLGNTINRLEI